MPEVTIRELWAQTADLLEDRPAARWLCEVATSAYDEEFMAALDEPVTQRMVAHLDSMLERLRTGEPHARASPIAVSATSSVSGRGISTRASTARSRRLKPQRPSTYCKGSPVRSR